MAIAPLPPIGALTGAAPAAAPAAPASPGFGAALKRGLEQVSGLEQSANEVAQNLATGGGAQVSDLMVATTKSQIAVDLLVAVRNRAVEAYQEVMRLPV
jgi:flagellar hook-basal body complex protein FliE